MRTTSGAHMVVSPCCMSSGCLADLRILVVEDHDDARRYLDLFLGQLGAKVMAARNAFEGLEAIKNTHPDLVLSDIKMPGMDGFELLDEIRALGPEAGGSVPVIATGTVGFAILATLMVIVFPTVTQRVIDDAIRGRKPELIPPLALLAIGAFIIST
jgi:DNA-binding NarL/FixJ family response regulator